MKKNLIIFGTRPEAIKLAPLIKEFKKYPNTFDTKVCITAQHREMLDQVLDFFNITPDYDLNLMKPNQSLNELTGVMFMQLHKVLEDFQPDYIFVQGDTTTTMVGAVAGFYSGSKICHVEAGLRTYNKRAPFPEEGNRSIVTHIADYHFPPTTLYKLNLLKENIAEEAICVPGNTVIDALIECVSKVNELENSEIESLKKIIDNQKDIILVTGHRRENIGDGFIKICEALKEIANKELCQVIFPVHLNPNVKNTVFDMLGNCPNIHLIAPLSYPSFVWLMEKSKLILSDSGGVQEEAPSLGKPVLLMRETTERPEAVEAGTVILVVTNKEKIINEAVSLLTDNDRYRKMSKLNNPYGDGKASERIVHFITNLS